MAENESDIRITTETHYLALTGDLWDVFCENCRVNWSCYNRIALYAITMSLCPGLLRHFRVTTNVGNQGFSILTCHGPRTIYLKLRVAHVPGMPGTFLRHRLQIKPLVIDPGTHHGTHVPASMSGSLTRGGGENVSGIPGACATRNFTYLARGPLPGSTATNQPGAVYK